MQARAPGGTRSGKRWLALVVGAGLVAAMLADTRFLDPTSSAEHHEQDFDPAAYVAEQFPVLAADLTEQATDITVLVPAIAEDPAAAGSQYGNDLGAGQYAYPVVATGTVSEVDDDFVTLDVPGVPEEAAVRVPVGMALNGSPVRDATGSVEFGDFRSQTDFQSVSNELKLVIEEQVLGPLDLPELEGRQVTVVGALGSGGPADQYLIQPVEITVDGGTP